MPIEKLRPSFSFDEERIKELKKIAPEAFADGKINWEALKEALGEHLEDESGEVEHFGLFWPGKKEARKIASIPSKGTLIPIYGEGLKADGTPDSDGLNDSHNIFIEGENLEVLKILQKSYAGRIKMIYIDPPYNTGNDFVYDDDFTEPLQEYLRRTGQVDEEGRAFTTNKRSDGRFHSKWLSMMYPRLRLARNLLSDNGVIFVSIDDNEVHHLRNLMNEVFGEGSFIAQIIWERAFAPVNLKKHFSESHDYILCYSKEIDSLKSKGLKRKEDNRYKNPDNDPRGDWASSDMTVGPVIQEKVYEIITPGGRKILPTNGRCWLFTKERFQEMLKDDRIWFGEDGNNTPRVKKFLNEVKEGITPMTVWKYSDVGHSQDAAQRLKELFDGKDYFDYPKSVPLIKRIIQLYCESNDIIIDFFSGSGTTAQAVLELNKEDSDNRRFILVQMPEPLDEKSEAFKAGYKNIAEIGKERIRRVAKRLKEKTPSDKLLIQDLGFTSFKLSHSNFKDWGNSIEKNFIELEDLFKQHESPTVDGSKAECLIIEIMLLEGFPLDARIKGISEFKSNEVKLISSEFHDHQLIICLDERIKEDTINRLELRKKDIFICLDTAISDQDKLRLSDQGLIKTI